ncbi:transposable element Tcb1 transposase [Trichonephila clavipes]|nr:transposable element Tcb1 transposase [Trichonephila clavipes]
MTAQRYVHDIMQPHVLPLMKRLSGAIFQQDNARPHTERVSQESLRPVTPLPLPARSPDLSPIEHTWDHLSRRVGPMSLNALEAIINTVLEPRVCLPRAVLCGTRAPPRSSNNSLDSGKLRDGYKFHSTAIGSIQETDLALYGNLAYQEYLTYRGQIPALAYHMVFYLVCRGQISTLAYHMVAYLGSNGQIPTLVY